MKRKINPNHHHQYYHLKTWNNDNGHVFECIAAKDKHTFEQYLQSTNPSIQQHLENSTIWNFQQGRYVLLSIILVFCSIVIFNITQPTTTTIFNIVKPTTTTTTFYRPTIICYYLCILGGFIIIIIMYHYVVKMIKQSQIVLESMMVIKNFGIQLKKVNSKGHEILNFIEKDEIEKVFINEWISRNDVGYYMGIQKKKQKEIIIPFEYHRIPITDLIVFNHYIWKDE